MHKQKRKKPKVIRPKRKNIPVEKNQKHVEEVEKVATAPENPVVKLDKLAPSSSSSRKIPPKKVGAGLVLPGHGLSYRPDKRSHEDLLGAAVAHELSEQKRERAREKVLGRHEGGLEGFERDEKKLEMELEHLVKIKAGLVDADEGDGGDGEEFSGEGFDLAEVSSYFSFLLLVCCCMGSMIRTMLHT